MDSNKPVYKSKTAWVALIVAVAAFFPVVQHFISDQPVIFSNILAGVFLVLRFISKGSIDIV